MPIMSYINLVYSSRSLSESVKKDMKLLRPNSGVTSDSER